ncbi:MAG: hypothetical protein ACE5NG_19535 [bacterium]
MGDAVPELGSTDAVGGYYCIVYAAEDGRYMDRGVAQPLPGEPAVGQLRLHPAVQALRHSPQPLVDAAQIPGSPPRRRLEKRKTPLQSYRGNHRRNLLPHPLRLVYQPTNRP